MAYIYGRQGVTPPPVYLYPTAGGKAAPKKPSAPKVYPNSRTAPSGYSANSNVDYLFPKSTYNSNAYTGMVIPTATGSKKPSAAQLANVGRASEYAAQAAAYAAQPKTGPLGANSPYANYAAGVVDPGVAKDYKGLVVKLPTSGKKSSGKSSARSAVARRLTGKPGPAAPPPPDPLETLRGQYDQYLQDIYGGLVTALKGDQAQYKTRSDQLAAELAGYYNDAAKTAGDTVTRTNTDIADLAKRLGLEQATQGQPMTDLIGQQNRLLSQNKENQAQSMATNDLIRSNYYDFLGNQSASALGNEATARAGLNDMIANAQLARQQALIAAAAAAAKARSSSRRRSGGGGGGSGSGSASEATKSTNDAFYNLANNNPEIMDSLMAGFTSPGDLAKDLIRKANIAQPSRGYAVPGTAEAAQMAAQVAAASSRKSHLTDLARSVINLSGITGGPKTSSSYTIKGKV